MLAVMENLNETVDITMPWGSTTEYIKKFSHRVKAG